MTKRILLFILTLAPLFAFAQVAGDPKWFFKGAGPADVVGYATKVSNSLYSINSGGSFALLPQSTFQTPAQAITAGDARWSLLGHTHSGADIVSGTVGTARLGSGTANSSTYLRGDGTWAAITYGAPFQINATGSQDAFYGLAEDGEAFHGVSTNGSAATLISTGTVATAYINNQYQGLALEAVQNSSGGYDIARFVGDAATGLTVMNDGGLEWDSGTGAQTTADNLPIFGTSNIGVVPASGGGTTNFLRADGTWAAAGGGSGTVTSVSVTTANGVSGSVATATTTPAITLTLGAITPTSVNGVTLSGSGSLANSGTSSLTGFTGSGTSSGTNTGNQTSIVGITGSLAEFNTALTGADFATGGGTATGANTVDVSLAGTPDYITISGQTITRGLVDLTTDVTGDLPFSNIAPATSSSLLLGRGSASAGDWREISLGTGLSMSGNTLTNTGVTSVGGTGTVNGLSLSGTVTTTGNLTLGGTLAINNGDWSGTDLSVANGGTGASTLTGYVKGSGTSALTASATIPNTDITGLGVLSTQGDGDKGDVVVSGSGVTWNLDNSGVVAGTYNAPQVTFDAKGRATSAISLNQTVTLSGDFTTNSATPVDVTGYTLTLSDPGTYNVLINGYYSSPNVATGAALTMTITGSPSARMFRREQFTNATTVIADMVNTDDAGTVPTTVGGINVPRSSIMTGVVKTNGSNCVIQVRAVRGGSSNTISVLTGSNMVAQRIQ